MSGLSLSLACGGSPATPLDPYAAAWEVHQAVEALARLPEQREPGGDGGAAHLPALRRALRALDRATANLAECHRRHEAAHGAGAPPPEYPDHLARALRALLARPLAPADGAAQALLAASWRRLVPFLSLSPDDVERYLTLLLSAAPAPPGTELRLAWLLLLVHASRDAWGLLLSTAAKAAPPDDPGPVSWLDRLFWLLRRALYDLDSAAPWSPEQAATDVYHEAVLWRTCANAVLGLVTAAYREALAAQVSSGSIDGPRANERLPPLNLLTWMEASLVAHLESVGHSHPQDRYHAAVQCRTLMRMMVAYANAVVEYALDVLDGALVAEVEQNGDDGDSFDPGVGRSPPIPEHQRWMLRDAMHHMEAALDVVQLMTQWSMDPAEPLTLMRKLWKSSAQAFVGKDEDGLVANVALKLATLYLPLEATSAALPVPEERSAAEESSTLILTLFRAVESCPAILLETPGIWGLLKSRLIEGTDIGKELKTAIQLVLMSLEDCHDAQDEVHRMLDKKFRQLLQGIHSGSDDWDLFFSLCGSVQHPH